MEQIIKYIQQKYRPLHSKGHICKVRCKKREYTTKVRCIFCDSWYALFVNVVRFIFDNIQFIIVDSFERKNLYEL